MRYSFDVTLYCGSVQYSRVYYNLFAFLFLRHSLARTEYVAPRAEYIAPFLPDGRCSTQFITLLHRSHHTIAFHPFQTFQRQIKRIHSLSLIINLPQHHFNFPIRPSKKKEGKKCKKKNPRIAVVIVIVNVIVAILHPMLVAATATTTTKTVVGKRVVCEPVGCCFLF